MKDDTYYLPNRRHVAANDPSYFVVVKRGRIMINALTPGAEVILEIAPLDALALGALLARLGSESVTEQTNK